MEVTLALPLVRLTAHRIGNVRQEGGEQCAEPVYIASLQSIQQILYPRNHGLPHGLEIIRSCQCQETFLYFIIGEIQKIRTKLTVTILNSQIPALVNHRQGLLHRGLVVDELLRVVVTSRQLVQVLVRMGQQAE